MTGTDTETERATGTPDEIDLTDREILTWERFGTATRELATEIADRRVPSPTSCSRSRAAGSPSPARSRTRSR